MRGIACLILALLAFNANASHVVEKHSKVKKAVSHEVCRCDCRTPVIFVADNY